MKDMPEDLKELLKLHDVKDSTIKLVHDYYSGVINDVAQESTGNQSKEGTKKKSQPSIIELARKSRIIK